MNYAIIETSGKQLMVEPGRFYDVNRIPVESYKTISLPKVLLICQDNQLHWGQPCIEGASVKATILKHLRAPKITVYKMRPKKKTRKKQGHRQELTRIMINSINL
uniref:Ribosomal protein L21 n=1 Tax=Glaucocystis sp. BBH TaxID=2023628 RepID=A0A3G1IV36_9EUKA|nr:ribosomal protein L21 [Glaucocystis sp. BBH]ASQ39898.1 ribosomal protein L21 [Glaucocystis sp. BBH]